MPTLPFIAMFCDRCEEGHSDYKWEYQKNLICFCIIFDIETINKSVWSFCGGKALI